MSSAARAATARGRAPVRRGSSTAPGTAARAAAATGPRTGPAAAAGTAARVAAASGASAVPVARRSTPAARPPLRVVPAPAGARVGRAPFALLVGALLTCGLLTLLLLNTALAQGAFQVAHLERRSAALADREQALQEAVALEASPQRLAQHAAALGMVPSENPAFIRAADGAILGVPEPGKPRPEPTPNLVAVPARPAPAPTASPGASASPSPDAATAPAPRASAATAGAEEPR